MTDDAGAWVSLYSGGKDSAWALHRALETGRDVARLVTVHPPADSFLYHVPATEVVPLAAESLGIALTSVDRDAFPAMDASTSAERGALEIEPLERTLTDIDESLDGDLAGITAGAVASEYQADLLTAVCDRLDCALYTPLWDATPRAAAESMLEAGFEIVIVAVAADGLDESWLGRRLNADTLADLAALGESHGVHLLGEGGEFETLVLDAPHMERRIDIAAETRWDGMRGHLVVTDATLED